MNFTAIKISARTWSVYNSDKDHIGAVRKTAKSSEFQGYLAYHLGEVIGQYPTVESACADLVEYDKLGR